jgi:PCRF domain
MASLARLEIEEALEKRGTVELAIVNELTPRDDADDRGVILEVRAGTGMRSCHTVDCNYTLRLLLARLWAHYTLGSLLVYRFAS